MSTFFQQTAQAMIAKHIDRFPLLKLDQVIDWQPIEQYLNRQRTRYLRDHRGRPAYPVDVDTELAGDGEHDDVSGVKRLVLHQLLNEDVGLDSVGATEGRLQQLLDRGVRGGRSPFPEPHRQKI